MIYKIIPKYCQRFFLGIILAFLPFILIDGWLPYALLSHYNHNVDSQPAIFKEFNVKVEDINFTTDDNVKISGWWIPSPKGAVAISSAAYDNRIQALISISALDGRFSIIF